MIQLKRILVPTDFSEHSRPALTYGCAIAARFDSELHLLHVVPDPAFLIPDAGMMTTESLQSQSAELAQAAEQQLQSLPDDGWTSSRPIIRATRIGTIYQEITDYARANDVDLIVIGTHGRSGLMHILMGSVAERIVREAPCPVLSIKPGVHQFVTP